MSSVSTPIPTSTSAYGFNLASAHAPADLTKAKTNKAREQAQDFEAMFLNQMFSQMFTSMDGEGPFGGGKEVGIWRSFLTDEYAKSFAQKGGIGLADHVYQSLMQLQEISNTGTAEGMKP